MEGFTELDVWKRGCRLCEAVYAGFGGIKDVGFRDQITRSALSVPSNIAEGYERGSRADFIRFLRFAKGSSAELRTQLYIAARIGLVGRGSVTGLVDEAEQISKMLQGLITRLQSEK